MNAEFKVTPWEVSGEVDYDLLVEKFGTKRIDNALLERMSKYGELHPLLRRGVVYSHRDMEWILDRYDAGEKFYLYTGRGPSGHTHLGHLMPWIFTKYLQDTFKVPLYFQLTNDEKFLFNENLTLKDTTDMAYQNLLDVIALDFDPKLTKIMVDTEYIHHLYPIALKVAKRITFSTARAVFGFENSNNIGTIFFTSVQAAPAFLGSELAGKNVPCLIPCGIDQDPHFRVARDIAPVLGYYKPALLHNKMFPGLQGTDKMSSSQPNSTIYTTDPPKLVRKKIMSAFTGGCVSVEEQRKCGGKPEVCSVFKYKFYLFEKNDKKLDELYEKCRRGEILCGECKKSLADSMVTFIEDHQVKREAAKDKVEEFMLRD
ncbi:tryptophan--tRNA ligase [Methanomassiliicoccus luminyensis]|jgi:tryptophanyl-tRNA synthetase|uniref:tryptophan--tRNA ligase n=1 Tax=Methanomassiliicoccus luminyensis TaxID=1080712 RepID=UPI00036EDE49|nr:tryptophan--tRNA ligase [Methanomassiliicoccus luminyensis]